MQQAQGPNFAHQVRCTLHAIAGPAVLFSPWRVPRLARLNCQLLAQLCAAHPHLLRPFRQGWCCRASKNSTPAAYRHTACTLPSTAVARDASYRFRPPPISLCLVGSCSTIFHCVPCLFAPTTLSLNLSQAPRNLASLVVLFVASPIRPPHRTPAPPRGSHNPVRFPA